MKELFNLKIAIIGCGNIAKVHLPYILKYVKKENICICDSNTIRLNDFAAKIKIKNKFESLDETLNNFKPDIVHILTPPQTHKDIACFCLQNGSHVLIEKPMCINSEEAKAIISTARENNRMVVVDLMRLYDPLVLRAQKILSERSLGDIVNVSATYSYDYLKRINFDAAAKWMQNLPGGSFFDVLPHPLCLLAKFLPGIKLENSKYWQDENNLITDLWCIFSANKDTGSLHMSLKTLPLRNDLLIECSNGSLLIDFRNFVLIVRKQIKLPNPLSRIFENLSVGLQTTNGTFLTILNFIRGRIEPYAGLNCIIKSLYNDAAQKKMSWNTAEDLVLLVKLTETIFPVNKNNTEDLSGRKISEADVLVTGGTGFIGSKLVKRLADSNYKVRILSHSDWNKEEVIKNLGKNVEIIKGDISNYADVFRACFGVRKVFHLAAAMKGDWNYNLDTTILGTQNICKACIENHIEDLIYVSTINVYKAKDYPRNGIIDETFPYEDGPEKRGSYSNAKLQAEKIVIDYKNRLKSQIRISIIRPGLVYGPGKKAFLQDVGYRIGKHLVIILGGGKRRLPLLYVDNLVEALVLTIENKNAANKIFNVLDNEYPTQREFIKLYKALTKEQLFTLYIPRILIKVCFWWIEKSLLLVFKKRAYLNYKFKSISKNVRHSTEYINNTVGWKPRVGLKEGLALTIQAESGNNILNK